jgi:hypothetical protein
MAIFNCETEEYGLHSGHTCHQCVIYNIIKSTTIKTFLKLIILRETELGHGLWSQEA